MDYMTGMSYEKHIENLKIERETIDPDCFDYCIKVDGEPIKLSLLRVNNLTEAIGWFDTKLEDHYPDELSFYLANMTLQSPETAEAKNELQVWEKAMEVKRKENKDIAEAFKLANKNREKAKKDALSKGIAKEYGHFTVKFE